jgi:hypothetical protein
MREKTTPRDCNPWALRGNEDDIMNTISMNASAGPLVRRFAWKEYRMLRGFWIASVVIGLLVQLLIYATWQYRQDLASALFMVAWGGAAFYSVGAAIMMFAAETEDHTRDYLRLLPGDWRPIFATKVLLALVTALLLGGVLTVLGGLIAGSLPSQQAAAGILNVAGIAVLEFLAWGLLFSMWWKHPLLAAVAAIAAASFGAQGAILATSNANNSWTTEAYVRAVPVRLAICLVVFAVDVWLGRRWLYPVPNAKGRSKTPSPSPSPVYRGGGFPMASSSRRMFGRLLWQTWREAWKPILVAVPLGIGLAVALLLPAYVQSLTRFTLQLPYVGLIPPALLGALAFRADQQRDHRLFLTTHAVWPRYVWLARQVVWLAVAVIMGVVAHYVYWRWLINLVKYNQSGSLFDHWEWFSFLGRDYRAEEPPEVQAWRMNFLLRISMRGILTAWCAIVSAYGMGQLCSMMLKQSLLSGFLAILLAVVIAAWSMLMFLWEMNPLVFVLPIGLVAFAATWLRAPAWILQQNHWKQWLGPAAAVVLPLVALVGIVPVVRQWQVRIADESYSFLREPLEISVERFKELEQRQQQTKLDLERISLSPSPSIEEVVVDGKMLKDHKLPDRAVELYHLSNGGPFPADSDSLSPEDLGILERFKVARKQKFYEENREIIPELVKAFNRPGAVLPFRERFWVGPTYSIGQFSFLLARDAERLTREGKLEEAWQRLLAIVPLTPELGWDAPTGLNMVNELGLEQFNNTVIDWATQTDQTSERLKQAISELEQRFAELPAPSDEILFYRNQVRKILLGQEVPRNFGNSHYYFLGMLPGEQQRAMVALDRFTLQALNYAAAVKNSTQFSTNNARELLRAAPRRMIFVNNGMVMHGDGASLQANDVAATSATSFLVAEQFGSIGELGWILRSWVANETNRRALLVELALIAYKLDEKKYPETLAELTPTYLPFGVVDPYSGKPFGYEPKGLEYELKGDVELPAHTPLLWSVGIGNMRLTKVEEPEFQEFLPTETGRGGEFGGYPTFPAIADPAAADPAEGQYEITAAPKPGKVYFSFENTESLRYGEISVRPERLVFPLPRIEEEAEIEE